MSITKKLGKDTVIFATKEDHADSSKIILPEPEPPAGAILPNGEINWDCPCLGGVASGPCGIEFREAFSCFVHSTIEPKGSECIDAFTTMQACMVNYPELYGNKNTNMNEDDKDDPTKEIDEKNIVTNSNETGNELNTSIRNGSVAINRDVLTES